MKLLKAILFFQIVSFLFIEFASAQKNVSFEKFYAIDTLKAKSINSTIVFDSNRKNQMLSELTNQYNSNIDFVLDTLVNSKTASHYLFNTFYKKNKIYNSTLKLSVSANGKINSCYYNSYPLPENTEFPNYDNYTKIIPALDSIQKISEEKVYFFDGQTTIPALKLNVLEKNWNNFELVINEQNEVLYQKNCNAYNHSPIDSLVKAYVFFPDPLTSSQKNYGTPYSDQNDIDVAELNAERKLVDMRVTFENDTFWLYNDFVKIAEFSIPDVGPIAVTTLTTFNYTRAQNEFEDVNVYYHLNEYNKYLKSLGFTDLVNYQIPVDTHGLNGQDNSMFSPATNPPRLFFGEGGVDDAEDADVIVHEYAHAISHSAAPNTNNGTERKTLDEANGDYFAASYSKNLNNFRWNKVYSWDGHNEYWSGRFASSNKVYSDLTFFSIYSHTDIWSATLMQIENTIGRNRTQEIVLESMHQYASNISMVDAAWLLVKADSTLNNGANYNSICPIIKGRGFTSTCPLIDGIDELKNNTDIILLNTNGFTNNDECLTIQSKKNSIKQIEIIDVQGTQLLLKNTNTSAYKLCAETFSKGIYILKITTNQTTYIKKIIK